MTVLQANPTLNFTKTNALIERRKNAVANGVGIFVPSNCNTCKWWNYNRCRWQ